MDYVQVPVSIPVSVPICTIVPVPIVIPPVVPVISFVPVPVFIPQVPVLNVMPQFLVPTPLHSPSPPLVSSPLLDVPLFAVPIMSNPVLAPVLHSLPICIVHFSLVLWFSSHNVHSPSPSHVQAILPCV